MAIKWSPGCGCCRKCNVANLKWIPSSPYDRGEYTDNQRWRPFTEYLQGDQFWEESTDRNGDTHKFLFTAPATMFSGGGWTLTEEARYNRGKGISYHNRLDDFYLVGNRWPHDEIDLHEYLQERKMKEGQGIVSVKNHIEQDYYNSWFFQLGSEEKYDSYDMPSLHIDIQVLSNVDHDPESEEPPTTGLLSSIKKALPEERFQGPYPENCIPSCEALTETLWNPEDPACGNKPPYNIEMVARHGTLINGAEDLSIHYRNVNFMLAQARSFQPQNGAVTETLDIEAELAASGETSVDLHARTTWAGQYVGLSNRKGNPYLQNQVMVVMTAGKVNTGETVVDLEAGDIIRIDDFRDVGYNLDSAFEIIKAADIVESERTHLFVTRNHWETSQFDNTSVERQMGLSQLTEKRVAFYVKDYRDDDFRRTSNGDYSVKFGLTVCTIERAATVVNPTCQIVPAWECECEEVSMIIATAAEIDAESKYEYCYPFDGAIRQPGIFDLWTNASDSGGPVWTQPASVATVPGRCFAKAAEIATAHSWMVQDFGQTFDGRQLASSHQAKMAVTSVFQYSEVRILDCIGKQDKAVMSRSATVYLNTNAESIGGVLGVGVNGLINASAEETEAMAIEAINKQRAYVGTILNAMICNKYFGFNDDMTVWQQQLGIQSNRIALSNGGFVNFNWTNALVTNVTPLTMELSKGVGSSCNFAISQNFHPNRSAAFTDETMQEQEFKFIDFCPSIANIPESQDPEAISLPNELTVLGTITAQAPVI